MRFHFHRFFLSVIFLLTCSQHPLFAAKIENGAVAPAMPVLKFQSAKTCQQCHQEIYQEWSRSWMAGAYSNPVFQQDFQRWQAYAKQQGDDPVSCLRCHAPAAVLTGDTTLANEASQEGVTCTICHKVALVREREGRHYLVMDPRQHILYGKERNTAASAASRAAHEIRPAKALSDSSLCAGCHLDVLADGTPLEYTWQEWKQSSYAASGIQCIDCHMPMVTDPVTRRQYRSHHFPGGHSSSELLQGVATIRLLTDITSEPLDMLRVDVTNRRAGHNFPTGGAHPASLYLRLEVFSSDGNTLHKDQKKFAFTFENEEGAEVSGREVVSRWQDTTLKPLEVRQVFFELPALMDFAKIKLSLVYELLPPAMAVGLPQALYRKHYKAVLIDSVQVSAAQSAVSGSE